MAVSQFADDDGGAISDINIVPLVDVVLVLLIVFMITVPAVVGSAPIEVNLPETQHAAMAVSADLPLRLALRREASGAIALYREDRPSGEADLRALVKGYPAGMEKPETFLAADKTIPYGEVVKIIDLLGSLGLTKLSLDTRHVQAK
jgi:biopolymer transport protein ExbD